MTDTIRTAIEGARAYLTEHPDEARYTDSLATARVEDGLRIRVDGPNGESLLTDMPGAVGGDGFTCEVEVDSESDDRGILGLEPTVSGGPLSMRIGFRMSAAGPDRREDVANWAVDHCPVSDAVRRAVPVTVELLG